MKKLFFLPFIFLLVFSCSAPAQNKQSTKPNKKAVEAYNKGVEEADFGSIDKAASLFQKAIELDPNYSDAHMAYAFILKEQKKYAEAIEAYETLLRLAPEYAFEERLNYAIALAGNGQFDKAFEQTNLLLASNSLSRSSKTSVENWRKKFDFAIQYAKKYPTNNYRFSPQNLGDAINSQHSEYLPSLTIDNQQLIFTRNLNRYNEDFFAATKNKGEWQLAQPVAGDVNTAENEGAQMISADGQWLVFTACNRSTGFGSCDIYISFLTEKGWSRPQNLGHTINSENWESQPCLSPDKKRLFFSSKRPGGYGGSDLYVSYLQENGTWSKAENLGPKINTAGDEQGPFLHADNRTLYFTSNGLPGYGDADLFLSRQQLNGEWETPTNLGYPINTIDQEGTLFIAADGITAYYSSDRSDSKGGLDLYSFELREDIRPIKTLWVKGKVFESKTQERIPATIELFDINSKKAITKIATDSNGEYLVTLPTGQDYAFSVNKKNYLFYSDQFLLIQPTTDSFYTKDIPLQAIEVNASIVLQNIFFETNQYQIKTESEIELNKLVQILNENQTLKVEIGGHTDNVGNAKDNLTLSNNRAKAVVDYLIAKGIAANRLTAKGYGETNPIASNNTEAGKAQNRRTEMKVTDR